ncbi:MAG: hypothetical protein HKP45_04495 [Winogradskyella sp.]|nr:hypothetical protein [Winogradskyella sp.]
MIKSYRQAFNAQFTQKKYENIVIEITQKYNHVPGFKIAETPVFIPKSLKNKLIEACEDIMAVIEKPNFKELTEGAFIDPTLIVPNEDEASRFVQLDFGVYLDENGEPSPKLIELQGFPTLYFYQELLGSMYSKHYDIPQGFSQHLNGLKSEEFVELLRAEIVGTTNPKNVVLLDIEPEKQATAIDFYCTVDKLGIKMLCISKVKKEGRKLYYVDEAGQHVPILKIYNRVIFDELSQRDDLKCEFKLTDDVDVEWVGHPNWFFRISKYTMPLLKGKYVSKSFYLDKLDELPEDLENYVLKPLYSFAGSGVQINVTKEMIKSLPDPSNYILQEKVKYHRIVETLDEPAICEIRMILLRNSETKKTRIVSNLMRLSKGEMIGVKYNKDKTWIGGSLGYFED